MNTGNVLTHYRPNQSGSGEDEVFTYDSRLLFLAEDQKEAAGALHSNAVTNFTYEYGTGARLQTIGPAILAPAQRTAFRAAMVPRMTIRSTRRTMTSLMRKAESWST